MYLFDIKYKTLNLMAGRKRKALVGSIKKYKKNVKISSGNQKYRRRTPAIIVTPNAMPPANNNIIFCYTSKKLNNLNYPNFSIR